MANKFNPLDPLGVVSIAKNQIDTMAVQAGLPTLPSVPGLQQRMGNERAIVQREKSPGLQLPGMTRFLRVFSPGSVKVEDRSFGRDRGV